MSTLSLSDEDISHSSSENEEKNIKNELEEMELGKLIQAKIKIENENKLKKNKQIDKFKLKEKFENINKEKHKKEPKEFSALLKPKTGFNFQSVKSIKRDPRFDDISGTLNEDSYKKNYSFVRNIANDYISKINNIKEKKSKKKFKIQDEEYNLIKSQINFVKGWVKSKEYEDTKDIIRKELSEENKSRIEKGLNPIHVRDSVVKKLVSKSHLEKKKEKETAKFLKRKQHREIVKSKKQQNKI